MADSAEAVAPTQRRWRGWLEPYGDRHMLLVLLLGFASGLPLLLTFSTLTARMAAEHINRAEIGLAALFGLPYALKFVWAPVIDRTPPPLPLGRRRGWGVAIQLALIAAIVALGACDPRQSLRATALLALLVAFLSASQDIVIDAWRVEILAPEQQGPGAGMIQAGYRIGMLGAGAGALFIADRAGWFASYAVIAGMLGVGLGAFLIAPEPPEPLRPRALGKSRREAMTDWFAGAIAGPLADFARHRRWMWILLFVVTYIICEALAGVIVMPLYFAIG